MARPASEKILAMDWAHKWSSGPTSGVMVLAVWRLLVKLDWWRRARWRRRFVVAACRGLESGYAEAAKLGSLDSDAGRWNFEKLGA